MNKILFWILFTLSILDIIASTTLGHISPFYNPQTKSTYSGLITSILAILLLILIQVQSKNKHLQKCRTPTFAVICAIAAISSCFQFLLGFQYGGSGCAIWFLSLIAGLMDKKWSKPHHLPSNSILSQNITFNVKMIDYDENKQFQSHHSINSEDLLPQSSSCASKCKQCCFFGSFILILLLMLTFMGVTIAYFVNWQQYGVYGEIIEIKSQQHNWTFNVHAYCVGQQNSTRPTIVLQHGGGSNSIAFLQLGNILAQKNWKLCSYDRLGYGRSSVIPRYLSVEERAYITNSVITKLLEKRQNKQIIIGGWSAGVQMSQIYTKIYPDNVKGMIFIDGYPDYLILNAIRDGKSQPDKSNAQSIAEFLRIIESLGSNFIVGQNPIANATVNSYYRAYYQTGYFWQSQYFDLANPFTSNTQWLTQKAGNSSIPYPNTTISLNWPDITVPLLVMPANETVNSQEGKIYMSQCEKFINKCTNKYTKLKIMQGDHGYVLKSPQMVANEIDNFFKELF